MTDGATDHELLAAHVAGDAYAFDTLVRRHQNRLWGIALRTTGNREDAADALQEALVNAYRHADSFRADSAVTTWLHRIVVNACLDGRRRAASRPSVALSEDGLESALTAAAATGGGAGSDARDVGDQVAQSLAIESALGTLPADQRAALVVVDVLGHDLATAAEILDCPVGTVKSRCSRARARLAPLLADLRNRDGSASVQHPEQTEGGGQQ